MQKPKVWRLFIFYIFSLAITYVLLIAMGVAFAVMGMNSSGADATEMIFMGGLIAGVSFPCLIAFGIGPFLPRKKWVWVYTLILIGMGMSSCWMPLSLYLMIKWVEPEVKEYYNA